MDICVSLDLSLVVPFFGQPHPQLVFCFCFTLAALLVS